jgi:uncharacterized membrane protein (UPF0127 family)
LKYKGEKGSMSGRFWLISILSLVVALLLGYELVLSRGQTNDLVNRQALMGGDAKVMVEIADEADEMSKGLGYRDVLDEDTGMLFIYPDTHTPRFWMKGMRFPLDFIWIRDGVVVDILENVDYPKSEDEELPFYSPSESVNWVLEVNSGWIQKHNVSVGDAVLFVD